MVKKIFVLILLGIVGYFFFVHDSLKRDFNFNGETYHHVKKMRGGEITNHFYTPSGESFETANSFIQILKFSDSMQNSDWPSQLTSLLNQYHLKPIKNQQFKFSGKFKKAGLFAKSYATPINIEGKEHMTFYVIISKNQQDDDSTTQKLDVINKLKIIQHEFN